MKNTKVVNLLYDFTVMYCMQDVLSHIFHHLLKMYVQIDENMLLPTQII